MQSRGIDASVSTNELTFRPGGQPVCFEVTVLNDSDRFAAFQLEVLAAGASRHPAAKWYSLSPEVSAAKPPGSSTLFQIVIFDNPIPGFVGAVNLTVRIFSPQLREERKLVVRLNVAVGTGKGLLQLNLPIREFQVYPRNLVEIAVQVRHLSSYPTEVVLRLTQIDPSWLIDTAERRAAIEPNQLTTLTFSCQPPIATQAQSQVYPFKITAQAQDGSAADANGILEVLPVGFIEFSVSHPQQTIPANGAWLPDWKSQTATFELLFKNSSNLLPQLQLQINPWEKGRAELRSLPETAELKLGETTKVLLETKVKRPWLGLAKTLRLDVKPELSDRRLGTTDPATRSLAVKILPVVPLWLILTLLAVLAALLAMLMQPQPIAHTDGINVVSVNDSVVLSGSDDCTVRKWKIGGDRLLPEGQYESDETSPIQQTCNQQRLQPKGLLAATPSEYVWSLQFFPTESTLVAIGLENGTIQLRTIGEGKLKQQLSDPEALTDTDRVLDMVVTRQSRQLLSGHGSGYIRVWQRSGISEEFSLAKTRLYLTDFVIRALSLSPDEKILVSAGNKNNLIVWDWKQWEPTQSQLPATRLVLPDNLPEVRQDNEYYDVAFLPNAPNLFVTADRTGFITIWDMKTCAMQPLDSQNLKSKIQNSTSQCQPRDRVQVSDLPVLTLDVSQDGRQLASGGSDGKVILWQLTPEGKIGAIAGGRYRSSDGHTGLEIYKSPQNQPIQSLKFTQHISDRQPTAIVSGGKDSQNGYFQVKLHQISDQ